MLQYYFKIETLFDIPAEAFNPAPKVMSTFVKFTPKKLSELNALNQENYEKVVKIAFQYKRKNLKNNFKGVLNESDFLKLNLDSKIRAETLSVENFINIENYLSRKKLSF